MRYNYKKSIFEPLIPKTFEGMSWKMADRVCMETYMPPVFGKEMRMYVAFDQISSPFQLLIFI